MKNLRAYNIVMGFLHAIQGIIILIISSDFTLPITTSYLKFDPQIRELAPEIEHFLDLKIGVFVAIFLFLSAIAHTVLSMPKVYEWYIKNLKKGMNPARWIEYSLSSSLMIVLIAMLVGVYDFSALILLFSVNAMMILCGWIMEVHNQTTKKTNWISYVFGCFAGIVPWVIVTLYLTGSVEGDFGPPSFVYWIFFSIFIFFNTFTINMFLQYKKIGKWKDYIYGEKIYILLSLLAKSALAWQIFAGTLRPV
jgi:hypothetical protein